MKKFNPEDIEQFVKDHINSKIKHNELHLIGFDMVNLENFKREIEIYKNALFEGICNGILMCDGKIKGIK